MKARTVCLPACALTGATLVLAGCVAQYRNPASCEDLMQQRFADTGIAKVARLDMSHRAVSYEGQRVVVEGAITWPPGSAAAASGAAASGVAVSGVTASAAATPSSAASAARAASDVAAARAKAIAAATTPVAKLVARFSDPTKQPITVPAAVECTYDRSGLTSFRWLAPASLAKTTASKND